MMKTKLALAAALLAGSATVAFANDAFDVNIYRPVPQHSAYQAFAQSPYYVAPHAAARPFTVEEKVMFDRAVGAID
jgi:hypothetical protein